MIYALGIKHNLEMIYAFGIKHNSENDLYNLYKPGLWKQSVSGHVCPLNSFQNLRCLLRINAKA